MRCKIFISVSIFHFKSPNVSALNSHFKLLDNIHVWLLNQITKYHTYLLFHRTASHISLYTYRSALELSNFLSLSLSQIKLYIIKWFPQESWSSLGFSEYRFSSNIITTFTTPKDLWSTSHFSPKTFLTRVSIDDQRLNLDVVLE